MPEEDYIADMSISNFGWAEEGEFEVEDIDPADDLGMAELTVFNWIIGAEVPQVN